MARRLIRGGSRFEDLASFSRAVVDGDMIYLSGTTGLDPATGKFADDVGAQTEMAFRHVEAALEQAGASLADVLRVVVYIADRSHLMAVCEIVGRKFKDIRPANTTIIAQLAVADMKVEIEVTARRGSAAH
jgi:enamine deaminase RidA (YjgF/YER057c/UK114 family)